MLREKTIFIKLTKIIFTKSTKISKRKLSRMVIFAFLCSSINFVNNTYAKERSIDESNLSAKAAVLIDGENGRILFGKNEKVACFLFKNGIQLPLVYEISKEKQRKS